MKLKLSDNRRLLFEFLSITFAVFLGLMLNQWKDNFNNEKLAKQSKDNILSEIVKNKTTVQDMLAEHKKAIFKIDSILTLFDSSGEHTEIYLDVNFQIISSTSWETAKLTQAIIYMDIDVVTKIAGIYDLQNYYESIVKDFVVNNIYNKPDKKDPEYLVRMNNFLDAIIPIENSLLDHYGSIQSDIEDLI